MLDIKGTSSSILLRSALLNKNMCHIVHYLLAIFERVKIKVKLTRSVHLTKKPMYLNAVI